MSSTILFDFTKSTLVNEFPLTLKRSQELISLKGNAQYFLPPSTIGILRLVNGHCRAKLEADFASSVLF